MGGRLLAALSNEDAAAPSFFLLLPPLPGRLGRQGECIEARRSGPRSSLAKISTIQRTCSLEHIPCRQPDSSLSHAGLAGEERPNGRNALARAQP
jgi:hypothetical protein